MCCVLRVCVLGALVIVFFFLLFVVAVEWLLLYVCLRVCLFLYGLCVWFVLLCSFGMSLLFCCCSSCVSAVVDVFVRCFVCLFVCLCVFYVL